MTDSDAGSASGGRQEGDGVLFTLGGEIVERYSDREYLVESHGTEIVVAEEEIHG